MILTNLPALTVAALVVSRNDTKRVYYGDQQVNQCGGSLHAGNQQPVAVTPAYPRAAVAWYAVFLLLLAGIVSHLDRYMVSLLVEPIKRDLGLSDTEVSLLVGASFAMFFVAFNLPFGIIVDQVNRTVLLALGIATWSIMTAVGGLTHSFWGLFASRAGVGISEACLAPAAFSLIADYFPPRTRGRAMSAYNMANYLGGGASMLVGGLVFGALGGQPTIIPGLGQLEAWQATLVFAGLPGVLVACLILTVRDPVRPTGRLKKRVRRDERFWEHMREAPLVYIAVHGVSALTAFTGIAVASWLPSYFVRIFDLGPSQAGLMVGPVSAIAGVLGCILSGISSDWLVARDRVGGRFLVPLAWWPAAALGLIVIILSARPGQALVGVFIFLLGSGFGLASVGPTIQDITPSQFRGQATSLHFILSGILAFGSAPTLVALVTDHIFKDPDALGLSMFVVLSPAILAGFVLCLLARRSYDVRRRQFISGPRDTA